MKRKRKLTFIIVVLTAFLTSITIKADNSICYIISLQKEFVDDAEPIEEIDNKGRRTPAKPIILYIYKTGYVDIQDVEKEEIISYSLYNEFGESIAEVYNDNEFTELIYSTSGNIQIIVRLAQYNLTGWIVL